ncbi:hypothetical protein DFJ74DRAFT_770445 [Hyaloraphidium curvatum]|nr:hypothetical protein DFJ74DRAFT_770445 [Hyaloraphidium curvatum]
MAPPSFPDFPLSAEDISPAWLARVLAAHHVHAVPTSVSAKAIGTGQIGDMARITIDYGPDAPKDAPRTLVAKMASEDPTSRRNGFGSTYTRETNFYRKLADKVRAVVKVAECYAAELDPERGGHLLLLEDLAPAVQGDQVVGCSVRAVEVAVEYLAKMHASFWKSEDLMSTDWAGELTVRKRAEGVSNIFNAVWPSFKQRYADKLTPEMIELGDFYGPRLHGWALRPINTGLYTLEHGDYRIDNILFHPPADAAPEWSVAVDWQTMCAGSPGNDIGYLLGASFSDPEVRRREQKRLLEMYRSGLAAHGVELDEKTAWDEFRAGQFHGLWMAVVACHVVKRTERGDAMFWAMFSRAAETAIETGAAEGIGLAVVERLLGEGYKVLIANRNEKVAAKAISELKTKLGKTDGDVAFARMDLVDDTSIRSCFQAALDKFGGVDVVVANSGYAEPALHAAEREIESGEFDSLKSGLVGNLWGNMLIGHLASHYWTKTGTPGVYVVTSSGGGIHSLYPLFGAHDSTYYPVAKAGQISYVGQMQGLANKLDNKCRYYTILPGYVWSSIWVKAGFKTPKDVEHDPDWGPATANGAGWTPMDKLADLYMDCINGKKEPGTHWYMGGQAGKAKPYPAEPLTMDYAMTRYVDLSARST